MLECRTRGSRTTNSVVLESALRIRTVRSRVTTSLGYECVLRDLALQNSSREIFRSTKWKTPGGALGRRNVRSQGDEDCVPNL